MAVCRIRRHQMHDALGHHLIADCLSLARLVDEYKRIYAVVLFIGKAIGVLTVAKVAGTEGWLPPTVQILSAWRRQAD